jgi:hypothetical protein
LTRAIQAEKSPQQSVRDVEDAGVPLFDKRP